MDIGTGNAPQRNQNENTNTITPRLSIVGRLSLCWHLYTDYSFGIARIIHEAPQSTPEHVYQGKPAATSPAQKKRSKSRPTPSPEPSVAVSPSLEEFVPTAAAEGAEKTNEGPRADFETIRAKAESGDADCQYQLGLRYQMGDGVAKNFPEAIKWYRKAAERNLPDAQAKLGYCYLNGLGVAKDETEAVKWYRKAAEQGLAKAQAKLGYCYLYGRGVAKDETEGTKWCRKGADQGFMAAQSLWPYVISTARVFVKTSPKQ